MVNPASLMKMMSLKNKFEANHPKFVAYLQAMFSRPVESGTIMEITITRPGESPVTSNIVVNEEDLEMFAELQKLSK